jgi:fumarate hydratase subunit alpha
MRTISVKTITERVAELCKEANYFIGQDVIDAIYASLKSEASETGVSVLNELLENYKAASDEKMAMCQDTGVAVIFVRIGQDVHITGGNFYNAINEGVRKGYAEGNLRNSVIKDPVFKRINTKDNTPAVIHTRIVNGDQLEITLMPKGSGAENMSEVRMLRAADGLNEIRNFVLEKIRNGGGRPCPPVIVGVGIGGNLERCAILSKIALLRDTGKPSADANWAKVEKELLDEINRLGIGPMGLGGNTTALAVHILAEPCHIASLPVAVNIQCHANRHKSIVL